VALFLPPGTTRGLTLQLSDELFCFSFNQNE